MNNLDLLKALNDIDDKFLLEDYQPKKNKNSLNYFREKGFSMRNVKLKYVLSPICVIAIVLVSVVMLNKNNNKDNIMIAKNDNTIVEESNPKVESTTKVNDEININKLEKGSIFDYDAKWLDSNLTEEFLFLKKIDIPEHLSEIRQGKIYVRESIEDSNYKEFRQYSISYTDKSEEEIKNIEFNFTNNKLLRDCVPVNLDDGKASIIDGTIVKIFIGERIKEPTLISGEAYFEYNDYKFDIKAYRLSKEEFINIVTSIVKEVKNENFKIEDKDVGVKELTREDKSSNENYPFYYGGKYIDEKGNNVILLTDDNEIARKEICKKLGITESNTIFKEAKYSFNYLTELQYMISNAMAVKELPFVISSALKEDTNNIEVIVNSNNEKDLKKLKMYDRKGGAISIIYSENRAIEE